MICEKGSIEKKDTHVSIEKMFPFFIVLGRLLLEDILT